MLTSLALFLSLAASAVAAPSTLVPRARRLSDPANCLVVGTTEKYQTVQSAVDDLGHNNTDAQCIFITKGTYQEQVHIKPLKFALTIYGETRDISSYASNTVTITQGKSQDDSRNNDETATLRAATPNLKVYNINLVNTRGRGSQALAVSARADRQGYYGCQFTGYQDTVFASKGKQIYAKCSITGATDFIFGKEARAWFEKVTINVLSAATGFITANGRDSDENPSIFVINNSKVAAAPGNDVNPGAYYLGRPWRSYARVAFMETRITDVINPAGWAVWGKDKPQTDHVTFAEFRNSGPGSKGTRAPFSTKLTTPYDLATVLGDDYKSWVDLDYVS